MKWIDQLSESSARKVASRTSRRSMITGLSSLLFGAAVIPLLPVARASGDPSGSGYPGVGVQSTGNVEDPGNPASCDYWRYCAIDGFFV